MWIPWDGNMTRLAIPNVGNYAIAFASLADAMGVEAETCRSITPEMLEIGARYAPEPCCLPFKAYLGHFMKAAMDGVEYAVMVNSIGPCRLRYYGRLHQKIIRDAGLSMKVFGLGYDGVKPPIVRHFNPSLPMFLRGGRCFWFKLSAIDLIEQEAWRVRPLELYPGDTSQVMEAALCELETMKDAKTVTAFTPMISARYAVIPQDATRKTLRVGLLGECSVLRDKFLNHNVEETLGHLGCHVRNFFQMGAELKSIFNLGMINEYSHKNQLKKAKNYLHARVGGHALDTVANAIRCAETGYDGVVHICPSGCMPEVVIRPVLRNACRDHGISLLELTYDEHTAQAGVSTRLEAFVDMLLDLREKKGDK